MKHLFISFFLCLFIFSEKMQAQLSGIVDILPEELTLYRENEFDRICCEDCDYTDEYGKPELPVKILRYVVPFDAKITGVEGAVIQKRTLPGNFRIYPAQPPILSGGQLPKFVPADPVVYHSANPFPGKIVEIVGDGYMYGYHIVTLKVYPVEYNPIYQQLTINKINYLLTYTLLSGTGDNMRSERQSVRRAELGKSMIESFVNNPQDVERFGSGTRIVVPEPVFQDADSIFSLPLGRSLRRNPVINQVIPDYLIITNKALEPIFQRLADWKTRKGVPAVIKTTEEINRDYSGNDLQEKIRNFLKDVYVRWGANLFVLLGGDVNIVPARLYSSTNIPTDLYYTTVAGDWNSNKNNIYIGNVNTEYDRVFLLGRSPVENSMEANVFIDKVLTYETTDGLPDLHYLNNYFAVDGFLSKYNNVLSAGGKHILEPIRNILPEYINYKLIFENHDCSGRTYFGKKDSDERFYDYEQNPDKTYRACIPADVELNRTNFLLALNNGNNLGFQYAHIIYHMDHSSEYGLGAGMSDKNELLTISDIDGLQNGKYYQIMFSGGCHPANFSVDCIAEHYLNLPGNGCVAFIGDTDYGLGGEQEQFRLFCSNLYSNTIFSYKYTLGCNFQQSLSRSTDSKNYRLHLLGDPEMPIWTNIPDSLHVSVNMSACLKGNNTISVTVNNLPASQEAVICLYKKDDGYVVHTVRQNGSYLFPFTVKTDGEVLVTVTSHNFIPYLKSIPVLNQGRSGCYVTDVETDDTESSSTSGNGDGQCDAGEEIGALITLCNSDVRSTLEGVTARVRCRSPYITLHDTVLNFGAIRAVSIKRCAEPFRFGISADAPEIWQNQNNRDAAIFYLDITDSTGKQYSDSIGIDIFASDIEQRSKPVLLPAGGFDAAKAGDSIAFNIELFNAGKAVAVGIKTRLECSNPYVAFTAQERMYPDIAQQATCINTKPFGFRLKQNYTGQALDFSLIVTDRYGRSSTFSFNLVKMPAIGLSQIQYTSTESSVELKWPYQRNQVSGYNIYRKEPDGNFRKLNPFIQTSAYYRDENLLPCTSYIYKIAPVSLSGNEGVLSGEIVTQTSFAAVGYFPVILPGDYSVFSSINTADLTGNGDKKIVAVYQRNGGAIPSYLTALHSDGRDMFNADNNVTTRGDAAVFSYPMAATPVIGDLDGDGRQYMVLLTRNMSNYSDNHIYCYSFEDNDGDGQPDLRWDVQVGNSFYRGAMIANMDNNPDGYKQVVLHGDNGNIWILDRNGQQLAVINRSISSGASPATADLDGDGDKEIVIGDKDGVYIYHHDGSDYGSVNPVFSVPGYWSSSSSVVCDLDGDGRKEILIAVKDSCCKDSKEFYSRLYAIRPDGAMLTGWDGSQGIMHQDRSYSKDISVGDLDGDGKLEVVATGMDSLKVWNNDGILRFKLRVPGLVDYNITPILADVDGDDEAEIVFGSKGSVNIYGYKADGSVVPGFPIPVGGFEGSVCIDDVDGDGKNELIAGSGNIIYMWKTNGSPNRIEWGKERHDSFNTGEYYPVCKPVWVDGPQNWRDTRELCGDLVVGSDTLVVGNGGRLSIQEEKLVMNPDAFIVVRPGASLVVDGGVIENAQIRVMKGGNLTVKNDGKIWLANRRKLKIEQGGTFNNLKGKVDRMANKPLKPVIVDPKPIIIGPIKVGEGKN